MKTRQLGKTNIQVTELCLGTMTWGKQNSEKEAHEQLDFAIDNAGINFIDTAEMYPVPPEAETSGLTESYLGNWLTKRKDRDKIILATKVAAAADWLPHIRDGQNKLDKKNIELAVDNSLKRLKTDYIDLYQIHWPERDTNYFGQLNYYHAPEKDGISIEESLLALKQIVQSGKIRHIGISNETPWGVAEFLRVARELDCPRIVSIQNPYNLLNRTFEIGLSEFAQREQVGLLAYSPLGFGVLSGKYRHQQQPENSRLVLFDRFTRYTKPLGVKCTEAYCKLAEENGLDPAQMALAFVTSRPFVTSNIIGATTMQQLQSNIESHRLELDKNLLKEIETLHTEQPNPCP